MKTTVWIRLDIETKPGAEDPFGAVDTVLDAGVLQDEVNGIDVGLVVTSALSLSSGDVEASLRSKETLRTLSCSGTNWGPCSGDVTHIDRKGHTYCEAHGQMRRGSGIACRKLRPSELRQLQRGEPLKSYDSKQRGAP